MLFVVAQTTSSRQSPKRSPEIAGVALVPLFEWTDAPVSCRVSPEVPYLSMWVPSRSSRVVSPSHQDRKLALEGLRLATTAPLGLRRPSAADDQDSAPALPDQMSSLTPRPLSPSAGVDQMTWPVFASAIQDEGLELSSSTLNSSRPERDGSRSPTCMASPWPFFVVHRALPLSSTAMAP